MDARPTQEELDLLQQLIEDGWPIAVIAPREDAKIARFQRTAISLVHRGLAGVYDDEFIALASVWPKALRA